MSAVINAQITDVWTISPNVINELRLGYTNQLNFFVPATLDAGLSRPNWDGSSPKPTYSRSSLCTGFYQLTSNINAVYKEHVYDPSDVVTLIRGKHILHFGGEFLFFRDNSTAWGNTNGGTMGYTGRLHARDPGVELNGPFLSRTFCLVRPTTGARTLRRSMVAACGFRSCLFRMTSRSLRI